MHADRLLRTLVLRTLVLTVVTVFGAGHFASAQPFNFQKVIDDTSSDVDTFAIPHLNDKRQVVFHGTKNGTSGIYVSEVGASPQLVVDETHPSMDTFDSFPFINNNGVVASWGRDTSTGKESVFIGEPGGSVDLVAQTNGTFDGLGTAPTINDSGTVAFLGRQAGNPDLLSINTRTYPNPIKTVEDTSGSFNHLFLPSINNQGQISFSAADDNKGAVYRRNNDGTRTRIVDNTGEFSGVIPFSTPNGQGDVAVQAHRPDGSASPWAIVVGDGGGLETRVEATDDAFHDAAFDLEINDNGVIAIGPRMIEDEDPLETSMALYAHDDEGLHRVLGRGDPLFGGTVKDIFFARGLNQNNEVAFLYLLENDEIGIAITTVPEPGAMTLVAAPALVLWCRRRRRHTRSTASID